MTEQEHLGRIKARCEALLEGAKKRTRGEWNVKSRQVELGQSGEFETESWIAPDGDSKCVTNGWNLDEIDESNFAFIASCAGPAEAGWKSTIAACKRLCGLTSRLWTAGDMQESQVIIAAWPVELL